MSKDDPGPPALVGRMGLVFAYLCFVVAIVTMSAAVYLLPLERRAKIFLAAGGVLLGSMVAALAIATHLVTRASSRTSPSTAKSRRKATSASSPDGADGSQRPR